MTATAVAGPALDFAALRKQVNKKGELEGAVREAVAAVQADPALVASQDFRALLRRVFVVLRSRCSNHDTALWLAGSTLTAAAQRAAADDYAQELAGYEAQCQQVLGQQQEDGGDAAPRAHATGQLFEGQLSTEAGAFQPPANSFMDLASQLFAEAAPQAAREDTSAQPAATVAATAAAAARLPPTEEELEMQRHVDSVLERIMQESAQEMPRKAPPASKDAVRRLPRQEVSEEKWRELGGDEARCPVCFSLDPGDQIMTLPCGHWAHPACMAPWLAETNSCPTCRHEMRTDDDSYERRKEREAAEEEDRRGAANALSHNEFLYT